MVTTVSMARGSKSELLLQLLREKTPGIWRRGRIVLGASGEVVKRPCRVWAETGLVQRLRQRGQAGAQEHLGHATVSC